LNLLGNYLSSHFESREMGEQVPWYEIPPRYEILSQSEKSNTVQAE